MYVSKIKCYSNEAIIDKYEYFHNQNKRKINENSLINLQKEKYQGGAVSRSTIKKIERVVSLLLFYNKVNKNIYKESKQKYSYKGTFITLTVPGNIVQNHVSFKRNVFNRFLRALSYKYTNIMYVSRFELQKRGQIHVHLLTNIYINYKELARLWKRALRNCQEVRDYLKQGKHLNAFITDIHSLRNCKSVVKYVTKYMTKKDEISGIQGRLFSYSDNLDSDYNITLKAEQNLISMLEFYSNCKKLLKVENDYCVCYYGSILELLYENGYISTG